MLMHNAHTLYIEVYIIMGLLAGIKYILQYTCLWQKKVFKLSFTITSDQFLITIRSWCWSMIHILDHQNNVSIAFSMSGTLGLNTLIIIIPAILAKIQGFWFFTFR